MPRHVSGFEAVAKGGSTAITDLIKQLAPNMLQNTLQQDFRMKHLQTQLDATKDSQIAQSELNLINNVFNSKEWSVLKNILEKGNFESAQATQYAGKLLPMVSAKVARQSELIKLINENDSEGVKNSLWKFSNDPVILAKAKAYLEGVGYDQEVLLGTYMKLYPENPLFDQIKEIKDPKVALSAYLFSLERTDKGIKLLSDIFRDPDAINALHLAGVNVNMYIDLYGDLLKGAIPGAGEHVLNFEDRIIQLNNQGYYFDADSVYNTAESILREFAKDRGEDEKAITKDAIEKFAMRQLSDPNSDAFKSFRLALDEGPQEKGFVEKVGTAFDSLEERIKGEDVTEADIERFNNTEWKLPSGELVKIRSQPALQTLIGRGKFAIRTQPSWKKEQSERTKENVRGTYPNWVEISLEELGKLGLIEIQR